AYEAPGPNSNCTHAGIGRNHHAAIQGRLPRPTFAVLRPEAAMNGTERKRAWRLRNPDASRAAERARAQARRNGYWGTPTLGGPPLRPCVSSASNKRYESTGKRVLQRTFRPRTR